MNNFAGVNKVEIDGVKETLTVIGDADPFEVVVQARKVCKFAEIASVGPPEQKKPDEEKKDKPKEEILPIPCPWNACDKMGVVQFHEYDEPATIACSIM